MSSKNKKKISDVEEMRNLINEFDYSLQLHKTTFDNPISLYFSKYGYDNKLIFEGLNTTYPIEKTIQYVKDFFHLEDGTIKNIDNCILVRVPNINNNIQNIIKAMDVCGYFLSVKGKSKIYNNIEYILLQFEAKFEKNESEKIRQTETILYHLTPSYNEKKILSEGFSPRCRNKMFNFVSRVYFIKGSTDINEIINLAKQLYQNNDSKGNDGNYTIFKIDITKIPENVKMFEDINYNNGIFISENIRPNCITNIGHINLNDVFPKIAWK